VIDDAGTAGYNALRGVRQRRAGDQ